MSYIFFSYSRQDSDDAQYHVQEMRSEGLSVWQDMSDIEPGENWETALKHAITDPECAGVVLQWSAAASTSKWVGKEIEIAQKANKTIYILWLDDTPLPRALEKINAVKANQFDTLKTTLTRAMPEAHTQEFEFDLGIAFGSQPRAEVWALDGMKVASVPILESSYSVASLVGKSDTWFETPKRIMLCTQFTGEANNVFLAEAIRFFQKAYPSEPWLAVHVKSKTITKHQGQREFRLKNHNNAEWYDAADACLGAVQLVRGWANDRFDIHLFGKMPVALGVLIGSRFPTNTVLYLYNDIPVRSGIEYTWVAKTVTR